MKESIEIEIALLNQTITQLNVTLVGMNSDIKDLRADIRKTLDDHDIRIRKVETDQIKLSERLTLWQVGQAIFTTSIGSLASLLAILNRR
jgi:uncharacterized coiled-coil protein SlyX